MKFIRSAHIEFLERRYLLTSHGILLDVAEISSLNAEWSEDAELSLVHLADVNGDSRDDLIVGLDHAHGISVQLGLENGEFGPASAWTFPFLRDDDLYGLATADFNNDGFQDIIVNSFHSISIYLNQGNGDDKWQGLQPLKNWQSRASTFTLADVSGDGTVDLILGSVDDQFQVRFGDGTGDFAAPIDYPSEHGSTGVAVGDLNGDGALDMAVRNWDANRISILLNDGSGSFTTSDTMSLSARPSTIHLLEFDDRPGLDLVFGTDAQAEHNLFVRPGLGDGSFAEISHRFGVAGTVSDVKLGDTNGNGHLDVVALHSLAGGSVTVFPGNAAGGFDGGAVLSSGGVTSVLLQDTEQGLQILVSRPGTKRLPLFRLHEGARLPARVQAHIPSKYSRLPVVETGDFNGDEIADVLAVHSPAGVAHAGVSLGSANGPGEFASIGSSTITKQVLIGDYDSSGTDDVVLVDENDNVRLHRWSTSGWNATLIDWGDIDVVGQMDLDRDGDLDLWGTDFTGNLLIAWSNGDATWQLAEPIALTGHAEFSQTEFADLNGDGNLDYVSKGVWEFAYAFGNGDGTFQKMQRLSIPTWNGLLADWNNDGFLDVIVHDQEHKHVNVHQGSHTGINVAPVVVPANITTMAVQLGDIDDDAQPELLTIGHYETQAYSWNDGDPQLDHTLQLGFKADKLVPADMDGDGESELLVVSEPSSFSGDQFAYATIFTRDSGLLQNSHTWVLPLQSGRLIDATDRNEDGVADLLFAQLSYVTWFMSQSKYLIVGDFDGDQSLDADDIDLLYAAVATTSPSPMMRGTYDLTGDAQLDAKDVDCWLELIANVDRSDFNFDGTVDFADFLVLSQNFAKRTSKWSDGDADGDGQVTFGDFLLLSASFGRA